MFNHYFVLNGFMASSNITNGPPSARQRSFGQRKNTVSSLLPISGRGATIAIARIARCSCRTDNYVLSGWYVLFSTFTGCHFFTGKSRTIKASFYVFFNLN